MSYAGRRRGDPYNEDTIFESQVDECLDSGVGLKACMWREMKGEVRWDI